jgi:hypothetical protein
MSGEDKDFVNAQFPSFSLRTRLFLLEAAMIAPKLKRRVNPSFGGFIKGGIK